MFNYNPKTKFINRGIYIIASGEYSGSFIVNIKEANTTTECALMMLPDKELLLLSISEITKLFTDGYFEYVKTIPKKIYKVLVAEYYNEEGS